MKMRVIGMLTCGALAIAGCGDDGSGYDTDASGSACPSLAGTWTIEAHCEASLVGDTLVVSQDGCEFSDDTFGFSGTVEADGTVEAMSSGADPTLCTGMATATTLTQTCTGNCSVRLQRSPDN